MFPGAGTAKAGHGAKVRISVICCELTRSDIFIFDD
jgi:hypothetical protein